MMTIEQCKNAINVLALLSFKKLIVTIFEQS